MAKWCRQAVKTSARDRGERHESGKWKTALKTGMPAGTAAQPRLPTMRKPRLLDAAGLKVPLAEHAYAQWR